MRLKRWIKTAVALFTLLAAGGTIDLYALSEPDYPSLTGRVVDNAGLIPGSEESRLDNSLASFEKSTGIQMVIVTLDSLQGYDANQFGYLLGRHWGIGSKEKDDGLVLLVAPREKKIAIATGYGLEGDMPDVVAKKIIDYVIIPYFKKGEFSNGIIAGTTAIIEILGGASLPEDGATKDYVLKKHTPIKQGKNSIGGTLPFFIIFIFIVSLISKKRKWFLLLLLFPFAYLIVMKLIGELVILAIFTFVFLINFNNRMGDRGGRYFGGGFGGFGGGFGGGGGFSGGGGSFGGGGASGGW